MKNILLVGSSSKVSIDLFDTYNEDYNFIRLSRDDFHSDFKNFDILDTLTFPEIDNLDGIIYFPGNINLKPFKRIKIDDFQNDYNINVVGLLFALDVNGTSYRKNRTSIFR